MEYYAKCIVNGEISSDAIPEFRNFIANLRAERVYYDGKELPWPKGPNGEELDVGALNNEFEASYRRICHCL